MGRGTSLRHGSLFSGIGGFDLAAEWMGWKNVFHCEIDEFCNHVLNYYWPKAASIKNIVGYEWEKWQGKVDVLSGGFPCQPFSVAGKRQGKNDDRHLWPFMLRAIRAIKPTWIVAENVLGIVNWSDGVVFEEVHTDLEAEGYQVQAYVLPAAGVNAPHRRERVWFIAHSNNDGRPDKKNNGAELCQKEGEFSNSSDYGFATDPIDLGRDNGGDNRQGRSFQGNQGTATEDQPERQGRKRRTGKTGTVTGHPERIGVQDQRPQPPRLGKADQAWEAAGSEYAVVQDYWQNWPTQSPLCFRNDGLPDRVDADTIFEGIPFPIKPISFSKWRIESIKALGNAIVPQVALQIFKVIEKMTGHRIKPYTETL